MRMTLSSTAPTHYSLPFSSLTLLSPPHHLPKTLSNSLQSAQTHTFHITKMESIHRFRLYFLSLLIVSTSTNLSQAFANSWVGSKYQIECTMCSACDNPCNTPLLPPPPPPSPPPPRSPSPPPPPHSSPSSICPPPPSPPSSGTFYYSPPPPSQPTTYSYPPPQPSSGGGGMGGLYPPPPYRNFPTPPPPNPIVPYFPFYYHSPPPPGSSSVQLTTCSVFYTIALFFSLLCLF
ncbi:extensin-like [Camellia sinensis]|uniref:extensin-like n=1 Tax=Camellia sinensis TaxID=4442 RepID=UPI001035939A|nr:extensin-like [Camellia sinensis]